MCDHHDDHEPQRFDLQSRRAILLALGVAAAGTVAARAAAALSLAPGMRFAPTPGIDLIADPGAHALPHPLAPTHNDILGPFWRAGAPFQSKLIPPGATGQKITLSGTVMDTDGKPIPDVILDFWNADKDGVYDLKNPSQALDPTEFKYRGLLRTGADGRYEVETVVPGKYKIPPKLPGFEQFAGVLRPSHIHVMTSHNGTVPLITQIYFSGDTEIAADPWAVKSRNVVALDTSAADWRATFNIVLLRFA
ncbi:MAG: hypothetical protein ACRCS9_04860 [Hyphomicrobium sp.]